MIYCVSDIHGDAERFHSLLSFIEFSEEDTLYIIGDIIDRGPSGVDLLIEIMEQPNIIMLMGNHEEMCVQTLGQNNRVGARQLWLNNGGKATYDDLRLHPKRAEILSYLDNLPDSMTVMANMRLFHLVHGMPSYDDDLARRHDIRLWGRPGEFPFQGTPGMTVIIGHTPTPFITHSFGGPYQIWHGDGIIDIDCGCGNPSPNVRLGCLRLDDMKEFYI